jgi:hypothetical protein
VTCAIRGFLLALVSVVVVPARGEPCTEPPARDATDTPPYHEFLVIPLRVHILSASNLPEVDCHLGDADVTRIVSKVNAIWNKAGIHWGLESLVREPAARQDRFLIARDLHGADNLGVYRILCPDESRKGAVLNLYYIHEFGVNGIWLGREAIVKETAQLRKVEGGIDEPLPRVSAHELGHALGLSHREDRVNLLASGTTGTLLNAEEVKAAREAARQIDGSATVAEIAHQAASAESAGDRARARRLWTWLAQVPGDGSAAARRQVERLETQSSAFPPRKRSREVGALGIEVHGVERLARRHEQAVALRPAEADVGADLRQQNLADAHPVGRKDMDPVIAGPNPAGGRIDVALGVGADAVGKAGKLAAGRRQLQRGKLTAACQLD